MNNDFRYLVQEKTADSKQLEEVSKFLQLVSATLFMHDYCPSIGACPIESYTCINAIIFADQICKWFI